LCGGNYRFRQLKNSSAVYDTHFEILPEKVKSLSPHLAEYDFTMDLYGIKDLNQVKTPFIITSRPVKKHIQGYRRALKPHEMNVLFNLKGNDLHLCKTEDVMPFPSAHKRELKDFFYFHTNRIPGKKAYIYNYLKNKKPFSKFIK
jgi:hypothetical protein